MQPGVANLPAADLNMVKDTLSKMLAGTFTRFDVFAGPIKDNTGKQVLAAGEKLVQADLDQFPPGAPTNPCTVCMQWWAEGVNGTIPDAAIHKRPTNRRWRLKIEGQTQKTSRRWRSRCAGSSFVSRASWPTTTSISSCRPGEVHALLGENGAGKSTLMNILVGLYQPDEGSISVDGKPVQFGSPRDAIGAGLGMVHQHFTLVPSMTVTENILLGLPEPRFRLDLRTYDAKVAELAASVGLKVDPSAKVWQLSVGEQQRVEILKMLYRGVRILIMDEPTAVLAPQEVEDLFKTLRAMTQRGESIVFISHKLDEVLAIADRITVLRRGKVTAAGLSAKGRTKVELARLMVGRDVLERTTKGDARARAGRAQGRAA